MPEKLSGLAVQHPVLFTTAKNDGAFWPAPETAKHEYGCWTEAMNYTTEPMVSAFIEFSKDACTEDHDRDPFPDGGHNCPMRFKDGGRPEAPWVLVAMKLYAQQGGSKDSKCYDLLWGDDTDSLKHSPWTERVDLREGKEMEFTQ